MAWSNAMNRRRAPRLDLDRSIPVLLTFASNRLNSTGSAAYRALFGIGIPEVRLLIMLAVEPDINAARICEVMGIDSGAASRTLRDLEAHGLVRQRPDDQNRAYRRWSLTPAGEALHDQTVLISQERDRILAATMTAEEHDLLISLLKRILLEIPKLEALVNAAPPR
jgi:DNA-binding MarR family transcriptional regulator